METSGEDKEYGICERTFLERSMDQFFSKTFQSTVRYDRR